MRFAGRNGTVEESAAESVGLLPLGLVKPRVALEEAANLAIHQRRTRQTLLYEEWIVSERREQLLQTIAHLGSRRHSLDLSSKRVCRHSRVPELLERSALLQIGPDLALDDRSRNRSLERNRRSELMAVVNALESLLAPDALVEAQIAG